MVGTICLIKPNILVTFNKFQVFIRKYFVSSTKRFYSMEKTFFCVNLDYKVGYPDQKKVWPNRVETIISKFLF